MNLFALSWLFRSLRPLASHVVIAVLAVAARALVIVPLWRFCLLPQNKSLRRSFVAVGSGLFVFALDYGRGGTRMKYLLGFCAARNPSRDPGAWVERTGATALY